MAEARFTLVWVVAIAAGALLVACDLPPREEDQWPISLAELVPTQAAVDPGDAAYRRTCIACHGADGRGNGAKTGADFTRPDGPLTKPDALLENTIRNGTKGAIGVMPAHGALLTDTEVTAVLAFVRRSFGPTIVPQPLPSAEASAAPPSGSP